MPGGAGPRLPLRRVTIAVMLLALAASLTAAWSTRLAVRAQEDRLLTERTAEVGLLLSNAIDTVPGSLASQGGILKATGGSRPAFEQAADADVAAGPGRLTFAWLRREPDGSYVVLAAAGDGLRHGDRVSGTRAGTFDAAARTPLMVATPVFGPDRRLGFALGPPAAPAGTVLYREAALGPVAPPRQAGTAPFDELDVTLYGSPVATPTQVLVSTTSRLPLQGAVRSQSLPAGASHWLLTVKAIRPLVGSLTASAPWLVLVGGLLGSALLAATFEAIARRRDAALALYAGEHQLAETLQRSLLPELPAVVGLDVAARYLAAGEGQQVGGDWFDVFGLPDGRVGIAVGDVMGHDLPAVTVMGQVRAALRAYAIDGASPADVVDRLDRLVTASAVNQLVTLVYGVLDLPAADGSRLACFSNAGHLPPLLRTADGAVHPIEPENSVLIGAPVTVRHGQIEQRLEPGATLLLFTDGLVERPGENIDEGLDRLAAALAAGGRGSNADALCDALLGSMSPGPSRDDVALLAIRVDAAERPLVPTQPSTTAPSARATRNSDAGPARAASDRGRPEG